MTALKHSLVPVRFALAILLLPIAVSIHAATVGYPRGTTSIAWAREPFALDEIGVFTCRYQQVYDAARFSAILPDGGALPDGGTITQLLFVVDNEFPRGFHTDFPDIQIDLSVTTRGPDQLSTNFSENLGTNTVTVVPRGHLNMLSSGDPGTPIIINLPVVFFYNPAHGNLLLDIQKFTRIPPSIPLGNPGVFEAQDTLGDSVSRVYSYDVNSPTGVANTTGLKTIFKVTPPAIPRLVFFLRSDNVATNLAFRWFLGPVDYTLQQSPVLGPGASWQPAGRLFYRDEEIIEVWVPLNPDDATRFFRLVSPPSPPGSASVQTNNGTSALSNQER